MGMENGKALSKRIKRSIFYLTNEVFTKFDEMS